MTPPATPPAIDLRVRALARLKSSDAAQGATAALGVLHDLAASPATAADALAVLHELQVHQVELELQAEELMRARAELEAALRRQTALYDDAPAGYATLDRRSGMHELNRTAATWLGGERDALVDRPLDAFLTPAGSLALHTALERVAAGSRGHAFTLEFLGSPAPRVAAARVEPDPAGAHFLVVFMDRDQAAGH